MFSTMRKEILFVVIGLFVAANVCAQGVGDSLIVHLKNGQRVAIPLADIRKITFDTTGTSAVTSAPAERSGVGTGWGIVFPNPIRTRSTIAFDLPEPGAVSVQIFDSKGTRVRVVRASNLQAGHNEILWDGLD